MNNCCNWRLSRMINRNWPPPIPERGSGLLLEENFPEALEHFNQSYAIYNSLGPPRSPFHSLTGRSARVVVATAKHNRC